MWGGWYLSTCLLVTHVVMCHYNSYLATKILTGWDGNYMYRKGGNRDAVSITYVLENFVKNLVPNIQLFIVTFRHFNSRINYI